MNTKVNQREKAPKDCEKCSRWREIRQKLRISESLAKIIGAIEKRLGSDEFKPTLGDYIKLLQMEKEFEQDQPKEITVKWVDPSETSDASK
jgi:hypothetical protein